ncbi:MAG TPA: translocation/assembly module TamB domain-containing protein, partial [Thermoanaerobaculia bacterium]|nr:translocation/assembly module TamB domain-containing protein [Thermoanaerobaculia bacterium]
MGATPLMVDAPSPPPRPRRRRWRRRVAIALLVLVVGPLLALLGALVALRSAGVRQAILGRVSGLLGEQYGIAFEARDFSASWRRSSVELRDVRLGAPGAVPFATVERLRAGFDLGSLRRRPLVVRWLDANGVRVDLGARLPERRSAATGEQGAAVEILRLAVRRGEVVGAPLAPAAARWLRAWSASEVAARGSYRGGRLEARVEGAEVLLDRPDFGRQRLRLSGQVAHEDGQPLRLGEVVVRGDGLRLEGRGSIGLAPKAATSVDLELAAETRALAAGLPPRGSLAASGHLELPRGAGRLALAASDLPAEALRPYVAAALFADLGLAGTAGDAQARVSFGPRWERVTGTVEAKWRQRERTLARAGVRLTPGEGAAPLVAALTAELLPGSPGRRAVHGTVRATGWKALAQATAEDLTTDLALPDLAAAVAEARTLWPRLPLTPAATLPLRGALVAEVHASGTLATPAVHATAHWVPQPGADVRVEAAGSPRTWNGSAEAQLESVPLALLGPLLEGGRDLEGTVSGKVELRGSPRAYRTDADLVATAPALAGVVQAASATLAGNGTLSLAPLAYRGALTLHVSDLATAADHTSTRVRAAQLALAGEDLLLQTAPLRWSGRARLEGDQVVVASGEGGSGELARIDRLRLAGDGRGGADLSSLVARLRLDAATLALPGQGTSVRGFHLEAEGGGGEVRIATLSGELVDTGPVAAAVAPAPAPGAEVSPPAAPPPPRTFRVSGTLGTAPLLASADLELHLVRPVDALPAATLTARLRDGVLAVEAPQLDTAAGAASLSARLPLAALRAVPQLADALKALPGPLAEGPVTLALHAPALDSAPLRQALGEPPRPERLRAGLAANLTLDLAAPALSRGEVRLDGLIVETPDGHLAADAPTVLRLAAGRLDLLPVHLRLAGSTAQDVGVELRASADLAPAWRPGEQSPASAITRLSAEAHGAVDAAILNAYLGGGVGSGTLEMAARAEGPPDALSGELTAAGPGVSFVWPAAALRIEEPHLAVDLRDGRWTLREGTAGLNGGTAKLSGGRSRVGELTLAAQLSSVRYRLAYGIDTLLSGSLDFTAPPEGHSRLAGHLVVDRGVLDRDVDLDREVLNVLFQPVATTSTEASALAGVDLDLAIDTTHGVRVKNNVGDLHATWRRLTLRGTLESPVLRGRIDLDPGGLFYAYGQTVRIDHGSLLFTGDPLTDPEVDFATTSSLQDPRIAQLRGSSPLDLLTQQERNEKHVDPAAAVEQGLAGYYGARVVQRLGESAGLGGFTVRPLLVFNETNPSARLTVGRDLSRNVSVALSLDLRNAERQTYLLAIADLRALPGLRVEGLTNDAGNRGGSLEQSFALGGSELAGEDAGGPRLRRVEVVLPAAPRRRASGLLGWRRTIFRRQVRNALGLVKGRPLPSGAAFGAEVDVADLLRRKGYPDPRIAVTLRPVPPRAGRSGAAGRSRVDVVVTVEPGPRVAFVFADDRPPRALRRAITALYRTDFYEPIAVEEMRQATVRAFRTGGHLDPQVAIEAQRDDPGDPDGARTVTVRSVAGPRRALATLAIVGLGDDEAARAAAASFPGTLPRAELAAGRPDAERRLLGALRVLGWPAATVRGRELEDDGARLVVRVEPGPRQTLTTVAVEGVADDERARLAALVPLAAGDPARLDRIAAAARRLEDDLRARGFADATVRSRLAEAAAGGESVALAFEVTPGEPYALAGVELTSQRWSRLAPFRRETGLVAGTPFSEARVEEARNRLFRTGVFSRVDAAISKDASGEARVTFALTERPRFRLGYGVRRESGRGSSAVLDAVDQDFL